EYTARRPCAIAVTAFALPEPYPFALARQHPVQACSTPLRRPPCLPFSDMLPKTLQTRRHHKISSYSLSLSCSPPLSLSCSLSCFRFALAFRMLHFASVLLQDCFLIASFFLQVFHFLL